MIRQRREPPTLSAPESADSRTLYFYASSSGDGDFSSSLQSLFRSVGYAVEARDLTPGNTPAIAELGHHILIAGAETERTASMLRSLREVRGLLVVRRAGASVPSSASKQGLKIIEDSADLYQTFEKIAGLIGLSVHKEVFLSYSRNDSDAADALTSALIGLGRKPWVDRSDLQPSEEWLKALRQGIEDSDSFLFLASRTSTSSKYCLQELEWAVESGKRIIPILLDDLPIAEMPAALASRQAIKAEGGVASEQTIRQVVAALDRDMRLVRLHQQILGRALKWKRSGDDSNLLLRGSELVEAQDWLGLASARGEPRPTEVQAVFITASRAAARSLRRKVWLISAAVIAITSSLAIWATFSAIRARREADNAKRSQAEQNAFGAFVDWDSDRVKAYLQADMAVRTVPDSDPLRETFDAMARNLALLMPELTTNLETGVSEAAFSPDLSKIVVRSSNQPPRAISLTGAQGARVDLAENVRFPQYHQFKFSGDGALITGLARPALDKSAPYSLKVWDTVSGLEIGSILLSFLDASRPPEIVGFTHGNDAILVESSAPDGQFYAYTFAVKSLKDGPTHTPWKSNLKFLLGQVDATLSTLIQVRQEKGQWFVEGVNPVTGETLCPALPFKEQVKQVCLAQNGRALGVVTQKEKKGPSQVTAWTLSADGPRQIGQMIYSGGPVFLWDVSGDGSALLVINEGADYPAEAWLTASGERVSIPVGRNITSPFVMKTGEEYKVLSFAGDERFILVREPLGDPLQGSRAQQLLLFHRDTLRLAAAPFPLPLNYSVMRPAIDSMSFATASHNGLVEKWNLLRPRLPEPRPLPVAGPLLGARFLPDGATILTSSRVREANAYSAQLDLWDGGRAEHIWQLPDRFDTRLKFCLNPQGTLLATASPTARDKNLYGIKLWDLRTKQQLWHTDYSAPVEAITFRADGAIVSTAGITEKQSVAVVDFALSNGEASEMNPPPSLDKDMVHLAFSPDGDFLLADYTYSSVLIWSLRDNSRVASPLTFSDAAGLRFDLGYDILMNLQGIQGDGEGQVRGRVSGRVPVVIRREGAGTTILEQDKEAPILSALRRGDASLYPVRGGDLLSQSGRWFALGTNTTTVDNASAVRVYDLSSGFPVTDLMIHQVMSRPGEQWPKLLSRQAVEFDPVVALAYREEDGFMLTLTTNGLLRQWPFRRNRSGKPVWETPAEMPAALTGRRFVSSSYIQRIPQAEYAPIREGLRSAVEEFRKE